MRCDAQTGAAGRGQAEEHITKIAVAGATGRPGRPGSEVVAGHGHEVVAVPRATGVDVMAEPDMIRTPDQRVRVFVRQSYGWVAPGEQISGLEDEYGLSAGLLWATWRHAAAITPAPAGSLTRARPCCGTCAATTSTGSTGLRCC